MLIANNSLIKTPDGKKLLSNISFEIKCGKLAYIYGPNGVGKTSLIKSFLGQEIQIDNFKNTFSSYFYLPQIENQDFLLPLLVKDISLKGDLLTNDERSVFWNNASGGQRKKALLERAFNESVELYLFDEPFNHLDEQSIIKVGKAFRKLVLQNKAVIVISHRPPDIEDDLLLALDVKPWM